MLTTDEKLMVIHRHLDAESAGDIETACSVYAEDIEHDAPLTESLAVLHELLAAGRCLTERLTDGLTLDRMWRTVWTSRHVNTLLSATERHRSTPVGRWPRLITRRSQVQILPPPPCKCR